MGARILSAFILSITGFLLCIMPGYSHGTGFQFLQYRVENGLKTDIIKTVDEDSLGFIWIGSDQGLMQYNGHSFINYPQASKSPFIKDLIKLRDGRLLVLDDLGLNEIVNLLDTAIFKEILPGTRVPTDTSLWYPKSIFEDSQGNLWIGEPQSVVRYDGNKIDRIEFGPRFNSSSFVRSFCFEEWSPGKILISSYNGDFFYYDNTNGSIEFLSKKLAFGEINHMIKWNGHLYIASNTGLYKIQNIREGQLEVHQLLDIDNISYLLPINDSELLINTFSTSAYIYRPDAKYEQIPYSLTVSNQSFRSKEGNIWLSTEKGLIMLKPQIFEKIPSDNENIYIESVALDTTQDKVYFSSKEHLRTYTHGDEASRIVDVKRNGYFLSIQWHQRQLWSSNASEIYLYNLQNQIISSWDFSQYGRYIFDLVIDKDDKVWFTQEASVGLKSIDKWGNPHFYTQDAGLNEELTIVRTGNQGIYAGSNDASSYLYYMSYGDSVFRNISRQVDFSYSGDLRIEDIAEDGDTIWLATSIGVLRQTKTEVTKVYFEQKFDNLLVKTIKKQANSPYVWFSNAYGLIQYNLVSGEYNVYDESHGLPSNTINTRGLIVNDDGIWVGTASGLAFSDYNFLNLEKTPKPSVVQFIVDNKTIKTTKFPYHELPSNPYIEIVISSPSYPSNKLRYQYKLENGAKPAEWTDVPDGNLLALSKLHSGKHALAFRAKKLGNYDWSEPVFFRFHIKTSLYETWYFKSTILLLAIFLILMTRYITSVFLKKRQVELEKLVNERTVELASANENLLMRNQELDQFVYSTSHDLSAPLKSIRGLINIANYETSADEQKSLLKRMNESVVKLEKFIKDVISYSRNARLEIKKETILLNDMVQEVLEHISNLDNFHKIKFTIDIPPNTAFVGDETRIRIILNNLISNAVKFQRTDESHLPEVYIAYRWRANKHTIVVRDNGQGIPNEFLDKIFHMFYRANYTSDGSGLGLYILKETVQKLDGEVKVESREGSGSEFSVSFP